MLIWDLIGDSCRVTLVVAFGFLPQNLGRCYEPMNGTLSFYECRLSGGDTMRWWGHSNPTCCNQICLNLLHSPVKGMLKHQSWSCLHPRVHSRQDPPCESSIKFNLSNDIHQSCLTKNQVETVEMCDQCCSRS